MAEGTKKSLETMSSEEFTDSEYSAKSKGLFEIEPTLYEKLIDIPGAMDYIKKMQKLLRKYVKRIHKLKRKLGDKGNSIDVSTQTVSEHTDMSINSEPKEEPKSFAEDIKEAAETAMQNMGFVYEETSGMYYDYNTGYYYSAEYGLYYDGKSGTYLKYNAEKQSYDFHSQVAPDAGTQSLKSQDCIKNERVKKRKSRPKTKDVKRQRKEDNLSSPKTDVEEGECSDSEDNSSDNEASSDTSEVSRQWPPCMRVIVESSDVPKMKIGSLHIITYDGGSLGREGNHSILIPDLNASKHHLKFTFDKESNHYHVIDLGSRNGTLLNGKRMSPSKQESEPMKITHGSKIQIGSTVLLCHIHDGSQTCGHCEPGLIYSKEVEEQKSNNPCKADMHKHELKKLKKIFGVSHYESDPKLATGYVDRAQRRRETIGSQNPHEKTKMASLDESITQENKGFKLLSKLGWKEGQSLGKSGDGILEPIKPAPNQGTAGVGCQVVVTETTAPSEKNNIWKLTQERFNKLPDRNTAFEEETQD